MCDIIELKNEKHERDPEMHSVKKGNQWHFGERMHTGVDAGSGYIHSVAVTAPNMEERSQVPNLVREDDEVVYGDAGYCGMEKREEVKNGAHLSQITWRTDNRKPYRSNNRWVEGEGTRWHREFERQKSRVRSKVEYPFLMIKRIFHYDKMRYRGLHKNRTQAHMLCALANLYMFVRGKQLAAQLAGAP